MQNILNVFETHYCSRPIHTKHYQPEEGLCLNNIINFYFYLELQIITKLDGYFIGRISIDSSPKNLSLSSTVNCMYTAIIVAITCTTCTCIQELVKHTPDDHPDHTHVVNARNVMTQVAMVINERKRRMESVCTISKWQESVDNWKVCYDDCYRVNAVTGSLCRDMMCWIEALSWFTLENCIKYLKDIHKKDISFCSTIN